LHLPLQCADGGIDRRQLALEPIAPENQRLMLALLVATAALLSAAGICATKQGREHGKLCLQLMF